MNEKIKELSERAGNDWNHTLESDKQFLQKFAELIVQECVSICKEKERPNLYGVREVEAEIKQHFGVE